MIYSIGHGTRPLPILLDLLEKYTIAWVVDVRFCDPPPTNPRRFPLALRRLRN